MQGKKPVISSKNVRKNSSPLFASKIAFMSSDHQEKNGGFNSEIQTPRITKKRMRFPTFEADDVRFSFRSKNSHRQSSCNMATPVFRLKIPSKTKCKRETESNHAIKLENGTKEIIENGYQSELSNNGLSIPCESDTEFSEAATGLRHRGNDCGISGNGGDYSVENGVSSEKENLDHVSDEEFERRKRRKKTRRIHDVVQVSIGTYNSTEDSHNEVDNIEAEESEKGQFLKESKLRSLVDIGGIGTFKIAKAETGNVLQSFCTTNAEDSLQGQSHDGDSGEAEYDSSDECRNDGDVLDSLFAEIKADCEKRMDAMEIKITTSLFKFMDKLEEDFLIQSPKDISCRDMDSEEHLKFRSRKLELEQKIWQLEKEELEAHLSLFILKQV